MTGRHTGEPAEWLGRWSGLADEKDLAAPGESLVDIEFVAGATGIGLIDHDRRNPGREPVPVAIGASRFEARVPGLFQPYSITGLLAADGTSIDVVIDGADMTGLETRRARLVRNNRATLPYRSARRDRLSPYRYRAPAGTDDGLPVGDLAEHGIDPAFFEAMVGRIDEQTGVKDEHQTEAVLVLKRGRLLFEEYFWGQTATAAHMISSCTKSLTSILAGIAWDRGLIDLDTPVTTYFPAGRTQPGSTTPSRSRSGICCR